MVEGSLPCFLLNLWRGDVDANMSDISADLFSTLQILQEISRNGAVITLFPSATFGSAPPVVKISQNYLVSLLEITRGQLLKGPHGIQLLGGLK